MHQDAQNLQNAFHTLFTSYPWLGLLIALVFVWTVIWKGLALWRAARNGDTVWFIVLLLVNTIGILEILYLFVFAKKKHTHNEQ